MIVRRPGHLVTQDFGREEERPMDDSILLIIKGMLGLAQDYTPFDAELVGHINSAIMAAHQLGIGKNDFEITGADETWRDWLGERPEKFPAIRHYIYMRTKLSWDPPANSFVVNSLQKQIDEMTWRLNVQAEAGDVL